MDPGAEDVVGFEKPGEEEENDHDTGGPGEDEQREGLGEGWVWGWLGFTEDHAADQGDSGGDSEEKERAEDAVDEGVMGLKKELRVFDGEEEAVKDGIDGEQTEEKGCELAEFDERALENFERRQFLVSRQFPLTAPGSDEGEAIESDPRLLQAIPNRVGHGVLPYAAEQGCEG